MTSFVELLNEGNRFADILIDDIAKRAGITRGAFYYFFESKEEVLMAAAGDYVAQVVTAASRFFDGSGEDLHRELHDGLVDLTRLRYRLQALTRALSDAAAQDLEVWKELERKYEAVVPRVAARLVQARRQRARRISDDAALSIARTLVWANERNFYRLALDSSTCADWDELAEALYAVWLSAFVGAEDATGEPVAP